MVDKSRYSFPQCPFCHKIGSKVESDIKKCTYDGCSVEMYWSGGYTLLDHSYYRPASNSDHIIHDYSHFVHSHDYSHAIRN